MAALPQMEEVIKAGQDPPPLPPKTFPYLLPSIVPDGLKKMMQNDPYMMKMAKRNQTIHILEGSNMKVIYVPMMYPPDAPSDPPSAYSWKRAQPDSSSHVHRETSYRAEKRGRRRLNYRRDTPCAAFALKHSDSTSSLAEDRIHKGCDEQFVDVVHSIPGYDQSVLGSVAQPLKPLLLCLLFLLKKRFKMYLMIRLELLINLLLALNLEASAASISIPLAAAVEEEEVRSPKFERLLVEMIENGSSHLAVEVNEAFHSRITMPTIPERTYQAVKSVLG